jgi:hypothetical protein
MTTDKFEIALKAINSAVVLLPEFFQLLEERKQRSGMTTEQILARAGVRFGENELNLLTDVARLTQPKQTEGE